jgi:tetratricopeptide (TPR) repeat protein
MNTRNPIGALAATLLLGVAVSGEPRLAAAMESPSPAPPAASASPAPRSGTAMHRAKKKHPAAKKPTTATSQKQSSAEEFLRGYHAAYELVYDRHDYQAGIAQLHSLGHDEHADVATMIGYASRKLGRYDDAKYWYDKALAGDPSNARTLSYYGAWHAEQGNLLKARDYLTKVEASCGNTTCQEYALLKDAIAGASVY